MTKFLFRDIIIRRSFERFFDCGEKFDSNFVYQVAFGFMPRRYEASKTDRYILLEEGDVTEIYFIVAGDWAVGFNSHENNNRNINFDDDALIGDLNQGNLAKDIAEEKLVIAKQYKGFGYIGDYYVFASKRSEFSYMAITPVDTYAITKEFMFQKIFTKFPGLHSEMLAESFSRYIKEFRRPVEQKRIATLEDYNKKHQYSNLNPSKGQNNKKEILERIQ